MNDVNFMQAVKVCPIIVALRGLSLEQYVSTAKALRDGGICMLEVTFINRTPIQSKKP